MKNNHCVPPCLRKFHKLGCIFFRKKIEKNQQNLVYRSKSDSEIIKLVKKAWKRKWLRNTEAKTFPSNYNGSFPLFNYRYAICNHNLFLYPNTIDKNESIKYSKLDNNVRTEDVYKFLNGSEINHSVIFSNSKEKLFRKTIHSSKCVHGKVKKNKQKMLKSTEEKTFKKYSFGPSPVHLINPQTTLVGRVKGITHFHNGNLLLNDKKKEEKKPVSVISNRNNKVSNPINENLSSNKWPPMENDDITSIIKKSLKTYMNDNAAFFENNIRSTCVYESVGELDRERSKDSVLQTHDENIFIHKNGSSKVYLESLLECAEIVNKNLPGSLKHKVMNRVEHLKEHEIFISGDFKDCLETGKHSNDHIHKNNEFKTISDISRNHMCSKKYFSSNTANKNVKMSKGCELRYKEVSDGMKSRKIIMKMEKTGILYKKRNNKMCFRYDINKNSASTLNKKNINSSKNNLMLNNIISFNLIKQMKNIKVIKSFSDSCVDLGKTSKFCCIKSTKNNINYSFHKYNYGTRLMETSTNLLNINDRISVKKVDFMKYDSILYFSDHNIYDNHINDRYKLKKIGKSYSNDSFKKSGMFQTFKQGIDLLKHCGDSNVTKDYNCSKTEMSYVIYSCGGDKCDKKYKPKHVIDDKQYCFADPSLYYCDSVLYLDNELQDSGLRSSELKDRSNYEILKYRRSTQSLNEGKEKPNLREEVFESHKGEVDTKVFQRQKFPILSKRKKKFLRKDENIEEWIRSIKKSESELSILSLRQKKKSNSELSILSDFGLNCNSYLSNASDLNENRPRTATTTRDVAVSAVSSNDELKRSRSTIDKAIMCDGMPINDPKHIMQLHTNNIIIESSEVIQLKGNGTSTYQSKDREISATIIPTAQNFLKVELYKGESQRKYLEWHCNQVVSNRSDHSTGTSLAEFGNISNDEFFGQREQYHKSKELEELKLKNDIDCLGSEENDSAQSKNIWRSLKSGSQKVFSFFQPVGPLRTCFKKNNF